ncbi:hypothetical protein [Flavobacterium sp.]|uniref:hypothetical protein n=1 Tax=Flavobacterium sp. TaxID=239 RepID=UPI00375230D0
MNNLPCFLIPIIVGVISAILGYLLGKMLSGGNNNKIDLNLQGDLTACRDNNSKLNATISSLTAELNTLKSEVDNNTQSFSSNIPNKTASILFDSSNALLNYGKKVKEDDLKIVEGIGPKIEELFHNAGIKTWKQLSETPLEKLQSVLDNAGSRFAMHNPSTWAKQCLYAYQGKWKELKEWQKTLNSGKE